MGSSSSEKESKGCKTYFIYFLRFLKVLAILSLLLDIAAMCMVMKNGIEADHLDNLDKSFIVLSQSGFAILAIICILGEFEPLWFIRLFYLFHFWLGRGCVLMWMGVQTIYSVKQLTAAVKSETKEELDTDDMNTLGQVVGWVLISVGLLYTIMGVLCIRSITGVDDDNELEVSLLGGGSSQKSKTSTNTNVTVVAGGADPGASAADALLIANMALALGMSSDEARKMLSGKNGQKTAEKMVKDRANATRAQAQAAANARYADMNANASAAVKRSETPPPAPGSTKEPAPINTDTYSQPPEAHYGGYDNDSDDDIRKKRMQDDDDLEAMYYSGGQS